MALVFLHASTKALAQNTIEVPRFEIHTLGFVDEIHTHPQVGLRVSSILRAVPGGGIVGISDRYEDITGHGNGFSGWYFDFNLRQLYAVGLQDDMHTVAQDDEQHHRPQLLNTNGQVAGMSRRYEGVFRAESAWTFDRDSDQTVRIGLHDPNATDSFSHPMLRDIPNRMNNYGDVAGETDFATSGAPEYTWFYNSTAGTIERTGLQGGDYDAPNGYHQSHIEFLTPSRHVVGTSERAGIQIGSQTGGTAAWVFDAQGGDTSRIGFFDQVHTRPNGQQHSRLFGVNDHGLVIGNSEFPRGTAFGHSGWIYEPATGQSTPIGLADPAGDASAFLGDTPVEVTNAGIVHGDARRAIGGAIHETPWVYNHQTGQTTPLGLFDLEHTRFNGGQTSTRELWTDGYVAGEAVRYNGQTRRNGNSVWWHDISTGRTERIGLTGEGYTNSEGRRESIVSAMNTSGVVVGHSTRYDGLAIDHHTPWIYDPKTNQTSTFVPGVRVSTESLMIIPLRINDRTEVAGLSTRGPLGSVAWFYDHFGSGVARLIGLIDDRHLKQLSESSVYEATVYDLNAVGQVVGYNERFSIGGSIPRGQSAWFFDPVADETVPLVFSESDEGHAFTQVDYFDDHGAVIGQYDRYGAAGQLEGRRPFWWAPESGFRDLEALVEGGLASAGWESLGVNNFTVLDTSALYGRGTLIDGNEMPYVLVATSTTLEWDFNSDGRRDAADIDLLSAGIAAMDLAFDVNGDGQTTSADHRFYVESILGTLLGDVNLDYKVDNIDFSFVLGNFNQLGLGWADGDVTADGKANNQDFGIVLGNFTPPSGNSKLASVPEPTTIELLVLAGALLVMAFRNRFETRLRPANQQFEC